ncbi:MAG: hypothetical protein WC655_13555 [Candidatus Hydrogenedentales bacterium]|jgi:hypothetical protein
MTPAQTRLLSLLSARPEGMSGEDLAVAMFGDSSESGKRKVRRLASELRPRVVSAPNCGYRLLDHATDDDLRHAEKSLRASALKMLDDSRTFARERERRTWRNDTAQLEMAI